MIQGLKTIAVAIVISAFVGALFGVILGALTENYLLWVGLMLLAGGTAGIAFGYGFLPEA